MAFPGRCRPFAWRSCKKCNAGVETAIENWTKPGRWWKQTWNFRGTLGGVFHWFTNTGWWFGTCFIFPWYMGIILPIDFHIFQYGWNHQPEYVHPYLYIWHSTRIRDKCLPQHAIATSWWKWKLLTVLDHPMIAVPCYMPVPWQKSGNIHRHTRFENKWRIIITLAHWDDNWTPWVLCFVFLFITLP